MISETRLINTYMGLMDLSAILLIIYEAVTSLPMITCIATLIQFVAYHINTRM